MCKASNKLGLLIVIVVLLYTGFASAVTVTISDMAQHDARVFSWVPDRALGATATELGSLRSGDKMYDGTGTGVYMSTIIQWDLDIPEGADANSVTSAVIDLRPIQDLTAETFRMYRLIESFDEATACWDNRPDIDTSAYVDFVGTVSAGHIYVDVSSLLANNGSSTTFGVMFEVISPLDGQSKQLMSSEYTAYANNTPSLTAEFEIDEYEYNLVSNSSFELAETSDPSHARYWQQSSGLISRTDEATPEHHGNWSLRMQDHSGGESYFEIASNDYTVNTNVAGLKFIASTYCMHTSADPLQTGQYGILEVEFFDSANNLLKDQDHYILSEASPTNSWIFGKIESLAPFDTRVIRVKVMAVMTGVNAGAVYFDDVRIRFDGDTNADVFVDENDLISLSSKWLQGDVGFILDSDFNEDYYIDLSDFSVLAGNWYTGGVACYNHPGGLISGSQIDFILDNINNWPISSAYQQMMQKTESSLSEQPSAIGMFTVPEYYDDPDGHTLIKNYLSNDAEAAYTLALAYQLGPVGNHNAYASKAVELINAWSYTNTGIGNDEGRLVMCYAGTPLVFAADLLGDYPGWLAGDRARFDHWLRTVFRGAAADSIKGRTNNWGAWGTMASTAAAYFQNDRNMMFFEINSLKNRIDDCMLDSGALTEEIIRMENGMWYTYFALAPMCATARIIHNAEGVDLFNYTSPGGHSVKLALDYYFPYCLDPDSWPWWFGQDRIPTPNGWPGNLYEVLLDIYPESAWNAWVNPYRPIQTQRIWIFSTLLRHPL